MSLPGQIRCQSQVVSTFFIKWNCLIMFPCLSNVLNERKKHMSNNLPTLRQWIIFILNVAFYLWHSHGDRRKKLIIELRY